MRRTLVQRRLAAPSVAAVRPDARETARLRAEIGAVRQQLTELRAALRDRETARAVADAAAQRRETELHAAACRLGGSAVARFVRGWRLRRPKPLPAFLREQK